MNRAIIVCILILLLGCQSGISPLGNINLKDGVKLVFYNLPEDINYADNRSDLQEKYGNFYIDDSGILDAIKHEWILEKVKDTLPINSFYRISLLYGQEALWDALYSIEGSQLLTGNQILGFDQRLIEKYSGSFKKLESYSVTCKNISDAKLLYKKLKINNIFVGKNLEENPLYTYNGITTLSLPLNRYEPDYSKIKSTVEYELGKIDGVFLSEFSASADNDSIMAKVLSKEDISNNIPDNYKIVENFKQIENIKIPVFGIAKLRLLDIIEEIHLKEVKLEEIK